MTTQADDSKRGRGAPKKETTKVRQNISISPEILDRAKKLAFQDGLSLSGWIEQMARTKMDGGMA